MNPEAKLALEQSLAVSCVGVGRRNPGIPAAFQFHPPTNPSQPATEYGAHAYNVYVRVGYLVRHLESRGWDQLRINRCSGLRRLSAFTLISAQGFMFFFLFFFFNFFFA